MRMLARFRPRLIGSVRTGHVRKGSDIDIHIFSDSQALVTDTLDELGLPYDVEHKRIVKYGEERIFTHIHVHDRYNFELTLYPEDKVHYVFKSSITGKAIERASIAELEALLLERVPRDRPRRRGRAARGPRSTASSSSGCCSSRWRGSSRARSTIPRAMRSTTACRSSSWPATSGRTTRSSCWRPCCTTSARRSTRPTTSPPALQALEGSITERTAWLIAHHMEAQAYRDGTLGAPRPDPAARQSEDFDDLMLLHELDRRGRVPGAFVCELDEALDHVRELDEERQDE